MNNSSYEETMKVYAPNKSWRILIAVTGIVLAISLVAKAHNQDPAQQPDTADDPISQLRLTPEQRQKIRSITEDNREERMRINRRLREAQFALEQTLDSDSPTESAVEESIRELSNAQAAQIRMRAMTELRIRSVLTPEQIRVWRDLRAQQRNLRRQINNANGGAQRLPNQRNGIAPLFQRGRRNAVPIQPKPQPTP